ncbi:hypothetical protein PspLS_00711 [Pyricularia sp. CBS 133598]|nr:hypothetical protein PspLS_00711 [Pyricularia sp. CBS 133598]
MTILDTVSNTLSTVIWPHSLHKEIEELDAQTDAQDKVYNNFMSVLEANGLDPEERVGIVLVRSTATGKYTNGMIKEPFSLKESRDVRAEYLRELTEINDDLRIRVEKRGLSVKADEGIPKV